ncbi:hypothetical protein [Idiomarina abyssalis]|uniref:Uncharacterized protein n=1 Tax=Idiomarina abyssalis TaxID=86102 RepID=A0A8I1GD35_9GAMM|nr:hypothetical protein [Idiomarina abyssalis]MBJ7265609.1 hypothetical protein [Idiomarina abyssalis]MBJ7316717.1 hypothetical protein [Idiomarina abyssalis]
MNQTTTRELAAHLKKAESEIENVAEQLGEFGGISKYSDSILTDLLKQGLIVQTHRQAVANVDEVDTASFEAVVVCLETSSELCEIGCNALDVLKSQPRSAAV